MTRQAKREKHGACCIPDKKNGEQRCGLRRRRHCAHERLMRVTTVGRCRVSASWTGASCASSPAWRRLRTIPDNPMRVPQSLEDMIAFGVLQRRDRPVGQSGVTFHPAVGTKSSDPDDKMTARSMKFSNSRTLPGHP